MGSGHTGSKDITRKSRPLSKNGRDQQLERKRQFREKYCEGRKLCTQEEMAEAITNAIKDQVDRQPGGNADKKEKRGACNILNCETCSNPKVCTKCSEGFKVRQIGGGCGSISGPVHCYKNGFGRQVCTIWVIPEIRKEAKEKNMHLTTKVLDNYRQSQLEEESYMTEIQTFRKAMRDTMEDENIPEDDGIWECIKNVDKQCVYDTFATYKCYRDGKKWNMYGTYSDCLTKAKKYLVGRVDYLGAWREYGPDKRMHNSVTYRTYLNDKFCLEESCRWTYIDDGSLHTSSSDIRECLYGPCSLKPIEKIIEDRWDQVDQDNHDILEDYGEVTRGDLEKWIAQKDEFDQGRQDRRTEYKKNCLKNEKCLRNICVEEKEKKWACKEETKKFYRDPWANIEDKLSPKEIQKQEWEKARDECKRKYSVKRRKVM